MKLEPPLRLSHVEFTAANEADVAAGLLGWVRVTVNDRLRLDGITLRKTASGRAALSFPARRDGSGCQRPYVRPLDDRARRDFESQIFRALGLPETATS